MTAHTVTWSKDKADAALAPYREAKAKAEGIAGTEHTEEFATLLLHTNQVPGMCPIDKIYALWDIAHECPQGDVVEIGTWWGKSALALLLLARQYKIGNVLCVDPWRDEELVQGVPHVDEASAALSAEEAFDVFKMNLLPYRKGDGTYYQSDFNYTRMTSVEANTLYQECDLWLTKEFGGCWYFRRIALLHIDGNHAYDKVKQDVELWAPLVVPGGWVVIDDYDWRHGDGPKRAADELIARLTQYGKAPRHFVAGGAMFVQQPEEK